MLTEEIKFKEAVKLVAETVYKKDNMKTAKNKASERIKYAVEKGKLSLAGTSKVWTFNYPDFICWLKPLCDPITAQSLPDFGQTEVGHLGLSPSPPTVWVMSREPEELEKELRLCREELEECRLEIARLEKAERQLKSLQDEKAKRTKKARDAGKRGGRGRKSW